MRYATAKRTKVNILLIALFAAVPMAINASISMWKALLYAGSKRYAFNRQPTTAQVTVPSNRPSTSFFSDFH